MGPAGRYGLSRGARAIDRSAAKTQSAHARNHRAGSAQRRDRPGSDFFVAGTPEARVSRQSTGAKTRVNLAEDLQRGIEQLGIALSTEAQITLLDSNSKKTSFVQQVIIELGLRNVAVHCARIEEWQPAEKFDGIISRAFAGLGEFIGSTRHLIAPQGCWAAMKGIAEQELAGVPEGCRVERVIPLQVPGLRAARSLVIATCPVIKCNEKGNEAT